MAPQPAPLVLGHDGGMCKANVYLLKPTGSAENPLTRVFTPLLTAGEAVTLCSPPQGNQVRSVQDLNHLRFTNICYDPGVSTSKPNVC